MLWLLVSLSLAGPPATIDLDGDGKDEAVKITEDGVKIGKHTIDCFSEDGADCDVSEVDLTSADKQKEVQVCFAGPRDTRSCLLYRLDGKELKRLEFGRYSGEARGFTVNGSGFVYAEHDAHRLFTRIEKFAWKDGKLEAVPQPIYTAETPEKLHVEKTFPLHFGPDSDELVGNAKPDSDLVVLGEHGDKEGWLLVRLSSGISGWMTVDTLMSVSLAYERRMSAG